ncbi:hypothetical protein RHGRI_032379 [Rhododendron griersonianum]|uniref:peptidylprolyl isomerase n=1 Tax=Rhododendron griersonianum TaxID=479676 RepID=A0AAV6IDY8_9ERIC|nr:hypothetical protein RHGRI_032379 [Rhododendron griersonianum]
MSVSSPSSPPVASTTKDLIDLWRGVFFRKKTPFGKDGGMHTQLFAAGIPNNGRRPCSGKDGDLSQKFWSTKDPGQKPFTFKIGQGTVIKGWDEGVMGMQVGEVARLTCSPDYAYGTNGFSAWGIKPNSVLVFEIEVLSLK